MAERRFVSRGGDKLDGALAAFDIDVRDRRALDAGAATGGFTDRLLQAGARAVVSVDVGYGQLDWRLRNDPRVTVLERTNVRTLDPVTIGEPVDLVVADLSFISLVTVADALLAVATARADLVLMVKPQFELPRDMVPRGGVVRDPDAWAMAMRRVADAYVERGCVLVDATASPITGPKGNREFFLHLRRGSGESVIGVIDLAVERAP